MFDFSNYTYSGLLSIISALFSIGYPLILNSIDRIDTKYNSTLLTARLRREPAFCYFRALLLVNLILAILIPFLMYGSKHSHIYIVFQAIGTICLIASTFCLLNVISLYGNINKLRKCIWDDYTNKLKEKDKDGEALHFSEWIDLSKTLLLSANQKIAREVYEGWYDYLVQFNKKHQADEVDYDLYFYDGLTRLNETLCNMPSVPISINNGNAILSSLITFDKKITKTTYVMLWKNLRVQLFYGKDDWIMAYWTQASQKYEISMQSISVDERNIMTGNHYTEGEVKKRDDERWIFLRFHIMLCAMIMEMGKYNLLKRILQFTQSMPPSYPLIPSTIAECCSVFHSLNKDERTDPITMEEMFPMPGMDGIMSGKILGAANEYISLLVYRIYTLFLPYGGNVAMQPMYLPDNPRFLHELKYNMETLARWLEKTKQNKKLLECVDIYSWDDALNYAQRNYGEVIQEPETIIKCFIDNIDRTKEVAKQELPYDKEKVKKMMNTITGQIKIGLKYLYEFLEERPFRYETTYWINGFACMPYPNAAFIENPDISYVNIEDATSEYMLRHFYHYFGTTFLIPQNGKNYNVDSEDIFKCLDKLRLNANHFVISFGIYWDYYLGKSNNFEKVDDANYKYKNTKILNLRTDSQVMTQQMFVMNYEDRPYLTFEAPNDELQKKYHFEKYDELFSLWLSLQKVKDFPDLISDEERSKMTENPDSMSVLAGHLQALCHWKKETLLYRIRIKHKLVDNGNVDDVNLIKPFGNEAKTITQEDEL